MQNMLQQPLFIMLYTNNQLKTVQKIEHNLAYMDYAKIFCLQFYWLFVLHNMRECVFGIFIVDKIKICSCPTFGKSVILYVQKRFRRLSIWKKNVQKK